MSKINNSDTKIIRIQLCSSGCCCPTVEIHYDKIVIMDDDGGKVTLTKEQWREALIKVKIDE